MANTLNGTPPVFGRADARSWETVANGVRRQILTYDANTMLVKVDFDQGGIGSRHQHVHTQLSYVESGVFAVTVGDERQVLRAGDCFYAASNEWHGVECLEAGVLLDVFNPARTDFL
ncbi:cupin domain-containing protein [Hymenobacter arizonensis]|uniref:Cupin domain protein n=1 Tax=Hymenobacter arizonensis TaxID=1227077 RepID=A0A1I5YA32_HYMAR|nr:cupin domain-containing protein [Hymenobacter arizonensis]SFQ41092.1 Cupin domain protein [Hymenobacter arizonensis]